MNDNFAFQLGDVSRMMRRRFDERARSIGVTRSQWRVLTALSRREGLNQGALAEQLEVEPITLCRMIDRLADAGLVERRRDPADRRAWRIFLTDRARPLIAQLSVIADELIAAALEGVDRATLAAVSDALGRIHGNLATVNSRQTSHG